MCLSSTPPPATPPLYSETGKNTIPRITICVFSDFFWNGLEWRIPKISKESIHNCFIGCFVRNFWNFWMSVCVYVCVCLKVCSADFWSRSASLKCKTKKPFLGFDISFRLLGSLVFSLCLCLCLLSLTDSGLILFWSYPLPPPSPLPPPPSNFFWEKTTTYKKNCDFLSICPAIWTQ